MTFEPGGALAAVRAQFGRGPAAVAWHLHAHFYPALLRSASVVKYLHQPTRERLRAFAGGRAAAGEAILGQ